MKKWLDLVGRVLGRHRRFYVDGSGRLDRLPDGQAWAPPYLVLSRALCLSFEIEVPEAASAVFVETLARMRLQELYPEMAGLCVEPVGTGRARVWCWDAERIEAALAADGRRLSDFEIVPETLLERARSGDWLLQTGSGMEGVVWQGGYLAATRYWPRQPSDREWTDFLRAAGEPISTPPPLPQPRSFVPGPRRGRDLVKDGLTRFSPAGWLVIAILVLGVPLVLQLGGWSGNALAVVRLQSSLAQAEVPLGDYREYRTQALEMRAQLGALHQFTQAESLASLLSELGALADEIGFEVELIRFEGDRLRLEVRDLPDDALADIVQRFDDSEFFSQTALSPRGAAGAYEMRMEVSL